MTAITKVSRLTGKTHTREINATLEQIESWRNGPGLIQHELAHLTPDDREFLLSGATPEEFDAAFPDE